MTGESYILIHIGPVQSWITQARRTQDLFAGSRLLSYLAAKGLQAAVDAGAQIVVPAVPDQPQAAVNYPNRMVIACATETVRDTANTIKAAIENAWTRLADEAQRYLSEELRNPQGAKGIAFNTDIWDRQIKNFLEVYYVFTEKTDSYKVDSAHLNNLMNSRKAARQVYALGEPGEKCTLTGEHEALHNAASGQARLRDVRDFWEEVRTRYPNKAEFNNGERLCAISTVKRLAHEALPEIFRQRKQDEQDRQDRFPSTSSIACAPFRIALMRRWTEEPVQIAAENYLQALYDLFTSAGSDWRDLHFTRAGRIERERLPYIEALVVELGLSWDADDARLRRIMSFDGDWFYADTLIERTLRDYTGADEAILRSEACQSALRAARSRLAELITVVGVRPATYYAILVMDGDDMGKQAQRFVSAGEHNDFSRKLLAFAREQVQPLIEQETAGRLVYSGGDDVLALVPVVDALRVADSIAAAFDLDIGSTMSAGIAIVHHSHNLREALQSAREAEAKAKDVPNKNAVCVEYLRRSGEARSATLKWHEGENVVTVVNDLAARMRDERIARQLAAEMPAFTYTLVPVLYDEQGQEKLSADIPKEMRADAFRRVFDRRIDPTDTDKETLYELRDQLVTIAEADDYGQNWGAVATLIELARFLSQTEVL